MKVEVRAVFCITLHCPFPETEFEGAKRHGNNAEAHAVFCMTSHCPFSGNAWTSKSRKCILKWRAIDSGLNLVHTTNAPTTIEARHIDGINAYGSNHESSSISCHFTFFEIGLRIPVFHVAITDASGSCQAEYTQFSFAA